MSGRTALLTLTGVPKPARANVEMLMRTSIVLGEVCVCGDTFDVACLYKDALPMLRGWRARHHHPVAQLAELILRDAR